MLKLVDNNERRLNYFRVSITDKCNLKCIYCTPNDHVSKLDHCEILSYEEILRLVKIGVSLGIEKVRITGGEPLLRKGLCSFIQSIFHIDGLSDLSLTTNGVLLLDKAEKIKKAGMNRINISLDSLDPKKYLHITSYDKFNEVWDGIIFSHKLGFNPIKINVVVIKGINDDEILDFARLSFNYPFHIRFIEYMPIGMCSIKPKYQILTSEIKEKISSIGNLVAIKKRKNDGPARRFKFDGAIGELGFISALSHHFCDNCNRLRLTADGHLRSCLLSDFTLPLKDMMRNGCSDVDISKVFVSSAQSKGGKHCLTPNFKGHIMKHMYSIGG